MTQTPQATRSLPPVPPRSKSRSAVHLVGELLITIGVLLLLFVAWQLWWTDVLAHKAYDEGRAELRQEWGVTDAGGTPNAVKPKYGKSFGLIYIPALRDRAWGVPVLEGTEREVLMKGFGHHPETAVPGEKGNFAIAGHRTTYGAPLNNIDTLEKGDEVIVETKSGWYVYELEAQEIINPWDGWILDPVPGLPSNTEPRDAKITIYSCHPKYTANQRYVWFGSLVEEMPKSAGTPPAIEKWGE